MSSILQLVGSVYIVDRDDVEAGVVGAYLDDTRPIARLEEVLAYQLLPEIQVGRKGTDAPAWGRINGDALQLLATFADFSDDFMALVTANRNTGGHFRPGDVAIYPHGRPLRDANYLALVIRDKNAPLTHPALYIPYALCIDQGPFHMGGARHTEMVDLTIISVDVAGDGWPPYEFSDDITEFKEYDSAGEA